jgi:hypothetical protein
MKTLPTTFKKNGWNYRQVKRVGRFAIYSQGGGVAYEVFKIRRNPTRVIKGHTVDAHEAVPPDSVWGQEAWTCHTLERAEERLAALVLREEQNHEKQVSRGLAEAA